MKRYQYFSDKEFAEDPSFLKWIKNTDPETTFFWETFLKNYPGKEGEVLRARRMVLSLNFKEDKLEAADIEEMRHQIFEGIRREKQSHGVTDGKKSKRKVSVRAANPFLGHGRKIAAAITILAVIAISFFLTPQSEQIQHATDFGKIKTILLPDSSIVTLNSNSTLTYNTGWEEKGVREVWLKGEAYFSVTHQSNDQRFVVHAHELNVEVLGTEFNVINRAGNAQVVLNTGKIKIDAATGADVREMTMQPGDMVEFFGTDKVLRKRIVNPEIYCSWRNHLLTFENHTVEEVIAVIENNFGVSIQVTDSSMLKEEITGTLPSNDIKVVLAGLSKTFGLNMTRDGDKVLIRRQE